MVSFAIRGPISRDDLPGLCNRVRGLLPDEGGVVRCDVAGVVPDAVTVDAVARLQLAAKRRDCEVRLCNASDALLELVELMGLTHVLPCAGKGPRFDPVVGGHTERMERMVRANGVELCVETFGDGSAPAVLLIAGGAQSMDWWETEFCEQLARGPRYVVRYDLRDTGRSITYPPGKPGYGGQELVHDAVGLLDALGVPRAHLVGISSGGGIAQLVALADPTRVASLTLVSTSPAVPGADAPLPPMTGELRAHFAMPPSEPDWTDREAVVDYIVDGLRHYAGSVSADEARSRALAETVVDRTLDIESSMKNHDLLEDDGEFAKYRLGDVEAPTLVVHGTEDPLFPHAHGEALAAAISGARLVSLEGVGHEVPPPQTWEVVAPAILEHTEERL